MTLNEKLNLFSTTGFWFIGPNEEQIEYYTDEELIFFI